jgi:type II secretory pathway component PulL
VLLVFLVQTGVQAVAAYRDARAAKATLSLAERDLRAARPDVGRIVNLRAQVAALKADIVRSGAHPLLTVNDDLVETLKANSAVRLDQVRHEEPGRRVTLRVSADSPEILDAFGAALRQKGLPVQILARSPENGRHVAEIVLEAP